MKNKILLALKWIVSLAVMLGCAAAFFYQCYPLKFFNVQFVPSLQSALVHGFFFAGILFVLLILLTLVCGRVYCSFLCPLGIFQEILLFLYQPLYKKFFKHPVKHYGIGYFILAVMFGTFLGGTVFLLRLTDPYSVFANALSKASYGIGFLFFLAVLVLVKKRFFCVNVCPVGALLGLISRCSFYKIRIDDSKCTQCGLCAKACPCGAIDFNHHTVNNEICVKCLKCLGHCHHQALSYNLKKEMPVSFNLKRRQLLLSGAVLVVFGAALKGGMEWSKAYAKKIKQVILPAGSGTPADFANRCLNCNLCVKNCPMKIIKPADNLIQTVHLDYGKKGYCSYNCHNCSAVCPSGAIEKLTLKEKQNTKIATAVVDENTCIQCGVCAMECPRHIIVKERGEYPIIRFDECIGCGKCATVCPVKAISIEPVDEQVILNQGE